MQEETRVSKRLHSKVTTPTYLPTDQHTKSSLRHHSAISSNTLSHLEYVPPRYDFSNVTKINAVYNAKNRTWQGIHDSITMVKK